MIFALRRATGATIAVRMTTPSHERACRSSIAQVWDSKQGAAGTGRSSALKQAAHEQRASLRRLRQLCHTQLVPIGAATDGLAIAWQQVDSLNAAIVEYQL